MNDLSPPSTKSAKSFWHHHAAKFYQKYKKNTTGTNKIVSQFLLKRLNIISIILPPDLSHKTIIDVGCGSGEYIEVMSQRNAQVIGLDYSMKMLAQAQKHISTPIFILSDAHAIPIKSNSSDYLIATGLLDYVNHPNTVLKEFHRTLKPNGTLIMTMPKSPSLFWFSRLKIFQLLRRLIFDLPPLQNIYTSNQLVEIINKHKFKITNIQSLQTTMWIVTATKSQ